ncbi:MAG: ornithine--oxo-acid transaminase [Betaproteobacteria bacterium]
MNAPIHPLITLENIFAASNYQPLPVVLARGEGVWLWDDAGRRYLDMMSAYSAVSFGHANPVLLRALVEQAGRLAVTSRAFHTDQLAPFLARICAVTGLDQALPMNTGAEAVETAIKAARKWAYKVKGVPKDQAEIIVCNGNFAGRTTTIVGFSSEAQYRDGFGPFAGGFVGVPFGNMDALAAAITPNTAAFLVEPVQGEAGIIVPPPGYLAQCAALCRHHSVLFICDEVQTGMGRTGANFAYQHEGIVPDGVTLGKALGGGFLPVSAFVATREVMSVFRPGDHGSTFGGNPLGAAVGLAAIDYLVDHALAARASELGAYLLARLQAIDNPLITDVRGKGLFVGVEVDPQRVTARAVCESLLTRGVLSKDTHGTVIRFAPPLTITRGELDLAVDTLDASLAELAA